MDLDKIKALALAYAYENGEHWYNAHELADGTTYEPGVNFVLGCSPATVLELIAEVERLRDDAGRYRWLRDEAEGMAGKPAPMVCRLDERGRFVDYLDGEELDDAIDRAAIEKEKS